MKIFAFICLFAILPTFTKDNRARLLCQRWKQVGFKPWGGKYQSIKTMPKIIMLQSNGTYEEIYGTLRIKGQWKFSADSSKFGREISSFNGQRVEGMSIEKVIPTDSIISLSHDTLIYGSLGTFGPGHPGAQGYGHDDSYFTRMK